MMLLLSLIPKELMQAQGARINTSAHVPLKGECVINPPLFPPNLDTCEQREKKKKEKKNQKSLLLFASTVCNCEKTVEKGIYSHRKKYFVKSTLYLVTSFLSSYFHDIFVINA